MLVTERNLEGQAAIAGALPGTGHASLASKNLEENLTFAESGPTKGGLKMAL